jgi:hypothetical protein
MLAEAGNFVSPNVGSAIAVTAADKLGGTDAGNYSVTQPVGLRADITAAINPVKLAVNNDPRKDNAIANATVTTSTSPAQGNLLDSHLSANQNAGSPSSSIGSGIGSIPGLTGLNLSLADNGIHLPPGVTASDSDKDSHGK